MTPIAFPSAPRRILIIKPSAIGDVGRSNAREGAWLFYTHRVTTGPPEQHAIDRYLTIAQAVGCEGGPVEFHFAVDDADRAAVAAVTPQRFAVLLPGANWVTKRW